MICFKTLCNGIKCDHGNIPTGGELSIDSMRRAMKQTKAKPTYRVFLTYVIVCNDLLKSA